VRSRLEKTPLSWKVVVVVVVAVASSRTSEELTFGTRFCNPRLLLRRIYARWCREGPRVMELTTPSRRSDGVCLAVWCGQRQPTGLPTTPW
jgi:hypothetical protein